MAEDTSKPLAAAQSDKPAEDSEGVMDTTGVEEGEVEGEGGGVGGEGSEGVMAVEGKESEEKIIWVGEVKEEEEEEVVPVPGTSNGGKE